MVVKGTKPPTVRRLSGLHSLFTAAFDEVAALVVFALFAGIEFGNRAVVAHDACPDFAALAFVVLRLWGLDVFRHETSFRGGVNLMGGLAREDFLVALGAELVLAGEIAVLRADRESRRDRDVRQSKTR